MMSDRFYEEDFTSGITFEMYRMESQESGDVENGPCVDYEMVPITSSSSISIMKQFASFIQTVKEYPHVFIECRWYDPFINEDYEDIVVLDGPYTPLEFLTFFE